LLKKWEWVVEEMRAGSSRNGGQLLKKWERVVEEMG
jgi:hypothetical protein